MSRSTLPSSVYPPSNIVFHNGSLEQALTRFKLAEICQGWGVHRDAREWVHYRDMFWDDAIVYTTWSGGQAIDDFINVSKKGFDKGDAIMHR
jgi:hypothetical protein